MGDIDDVGDAVADELTFDLDVDASDITVRAVGGAVLLTGTVPSYPQYLVAVAGARRVAGARNLRDDLEIRLPPGDFRDDALTLNEATPASVQAPKLVSGRTPEVLLGASAIHSALASLHVAAAQFLVTVKLLAGRPYHLLGDQERHEVHAQAHRLDQPG